jgi:protein arginine N-methyltransferase 1
MVEEHRLMLADRRRTNAFKAAISQCIKPGDRVVDIGAGTGILSLFACRAGAEKVYAIESTAMVSLARKFAEENGYADRVSFIHAHSLEARLPEKVDAVVSETLGHGGLEENILGSLLNARTRFLKPGGIIIPRRIIIYAAPAHVPQIIRRQKFWDTRKYGLDFRPAQEYAQNMVHPRRLQPGQILTKPQKIFDLDLRRIKRDRVFGRARFCFSRSLTFSGFACWFQAELAKNIILDNAPASPRTHWFQLFFPAPDTYQLGAGGQVRFLLKTIPLKKRFFWEWQIEITMPGAKKPAVVQNFSNFRGFPLAYD